MKIKMWSLINTKKNKIIKIGIDNGDYYVVGFETKKGLLETIDFFLEDWEKIKKIEFEI